MAAHNRQKKEITKNDMAVVNGFCNAMNKQPLAKRIKIAWRIILGRF